MQTKRLNYSHNGLSRRASVPCSNECDGHPTVCIGRATIGYTHFDLVEVRVFAHAKIIMSKIMSNWSPNSPKTPLKLDMLDN